MTSGDESESPLADVTHQRRSRPVGALITVLLLVGAAMLATSGILHLYLWGHKDLRYRDVKTVGTLFLLQGLAGCVLAVAVAVWRRPIVALAGAAYLAASMAGLIKSINGGLFGNGETLDAPYVKMSLTIEIVGLAVFAAALVLLVTGARRRGRLAR
jgi:hypothetical protein